jgi:hypothetical protein
MLYRQKGSRQKGSRLKIQGMKHQKYNVCYTLDKTLLLCPNNGRALGFSNRYELCRSGS